MRATRAIGLLLGVLAGPGCGDAGGAGPDGGPGEVPTADAGLDSGVITLQPARYPVDQTHSPITSFVAQRLRDAAGASRDQAVFAKIGDSITVSNQFMHCFASGPDSITAQVDQSVAHFAQGDPAPFQRESVAAGVGWSSGMVLAGAPSPLAQEIDATNASIAVVMYGTNDAEGGNLDLFGGNLLTIVDELLAAGVVPIVSTVPPRDYNANDVRIPFYNDMVRAVAEARQVPMVDFYREAALLPGFGLGGDGLHPRAVGGGCDFSAQGLEAGYNTRNQVTMVAIDRLRRILDGSEPQFDSAAPTWQGAGSKADPFVVDLSSLPFTHSGDTRDSGERHNEVYACSAANEGGAERWYRLDTASEVTLRVNLADRGETDLDVHFLRGGDSASACAARDDRSMDITVPAGENYLVVDTYVAGGVEKAGEYLLTFSAL